MHVLINAINDNATVRGPDRYLLGLLSGLAEIDRRTRYTITYAPWQEAFRAPDLPSNFSTVCLNPPRHRIPRVAWHACVFPFQVRRLQPDIVHQPNIIFAPALGRPVIMTVHDLAHFRFPEKFGLMRGWTQRALIRAAFWNVDRAIAVSEFTRGDMDRFTTYPNARTTVVHEGGPSPRPRRDPAASDKPFFLYVGVIERSKNIEQLIVEFCESEKLRQQDYELMIVGRAGNAMARVARLVAERGEGRVKLTGFVSEDRLEELYGTCQAMVFPSLVEGFGLVLLEAMAHGARIIAMNTSAIPEVVGDAGILVEPNVGGDLRRAMERLADDAELGKALEKRGYEQLARFSWIEAAKQTRALYERAAGGDHASSDSRRPVLQQRGADRAMP
jgi:glycosyltransferase involved in cell wall biosynthesis